MGQGESFNKTLKADSSDAVSGLHIDTKDSVQSVGSDVLLSRNCSLETLERADKPTTMA